MHIVEPHNPATVFAVDIQPFFFFFFALTLPEGILLPRPLRSHRASKSSCWHDTVISLAPPRPNVFLLDVCPPVAMVPRTTETSLRRACGELGKTGSVIAFVDGALLWRLLYRCPVPVRHLFFVGLGLTAAGDIHFAAVV